jgi:hypothetical protein
LKIYKILQITDSENCISSSEDATIKIWNCLNPSNIIDFFQESSQITSFVYLNEYNIISYLSENDRQLNNIIVQNKSKLDIKI